MSRILSPNPLVITITVNEVTGNITAQPSKPAPHIQLAAIYSQLITATLADAMTQAGMPPGIPSQTPSPDPSKRGGGTNGPAN
jgi:hypothetical protein